MNSRTGLNLLCFVFLFPTISVGQQLENIKIENNRVREVKVASQVITIHKPLVSFEVNQKEYESDKLSPLIICLVLK